MYRYSIAIFRCAEGPKISHQVVLWRLGPSSFVVQRHVQVRCNECWKPTETQDYIVWILRLDRCVCILEHLEITFDSSRPKITCPSVPPCELIPNLPEPNFWIFSNGSCRVSMPIFKSPALTERICETPLAEKQKPLSSFAELALESMKTRERGSRRFSYRSKGPNPYLF